MINSSGIPQSQPLVILKGEYGIVEGDNEVIASPNAKSGVVIILSDQTNKILGMTHFDCEENLEENLETILSEMATLGADIKNLKCNLIENVKS